MNHHVSVGNHHFSTENHRFSDYSPHAARSLSPGIVHSVKQCVEAAFVREYIEVSICKGIAGLMVASWAVGRLALRHRRACQPHHRRQLHLKFTTPFHSRRYRHFDRCKSRARSYLNLVPGAMPRRHRHRKVLPKLAPAGRRGGCNYVPAPANIYVTNSINLPLRLGLLCDR